MGNNMRKMFFATFLAFSSLLFAQEEIKFYPEMCDALQAVFCDYAEREGEVKYISSRDGQYIGNLINNNIYGWGYFLSNNGAQTFGQYCNGKHLFGITLTGEMARVGTEEHFVEYDVVTGNIMRVHTTAGDLRIAAPYVPTATEPAAYTFKQVKYDNGDAYYGEMYNGRRHGYGVYYWANGDFWYGKYENGYRQGYGALFKPDRRIYFGKWVGDSKMK